jgi:F-type H+-transporting ATPase subunit a
VTETTPTRRIGFKRWIVIALILLGIYLGFIVGGIFKPVSPAVVLPGEAVWPGALLLPGLPLTNTLVTVFIIDLLLLALALATRGFLRSGKLVPQGFYHIVEMLVEFLWNTTSSTAGKWARRMFPIMATIFLLVLLANLSELIPFVESFGYLKQAEGSEKGYAAVQLANGLYALDGSHVVTAEEGGTPANGICTACTVVPFFHVPSTDLNFTIALALVAMLAVEYFGFRALGFSYLTKFFNFGGMINKPVFGVIDMGVGLLELVSEFSKIISFAFRLFGNLFAGGLLLSVLGALTVAVIPSFLVVLELFVGAVQAYVFSMLALVFMSQAVVGHGGDHDEHAEAPAAAH